jgi:hypothetical protein
VYNVSNKLRIFQRCRDAGLKTLYEFRPNPIMGNGHIASLTNEFMLFRRAATGLHRCMERLIVKKSFEKSPNVTR